MTPAVVFVTGGTGYLGRPLIARLLARGCAVHALARAGSEAKLPAGSVVVRGDALDASTFAAAMPAGATVVHLVGTPHPNPSKAAEFQRVDLASIRATTTACRQRGDVHHLVYVSVAHPAPIMKAYIGVRMEGESLVRSLGVPATIFRPWYVLGPGHYWPYLLVPIYAVMTMIPRTRERAERLGLVTHTQMLDALESAVVEPPAAGVRVFAVPDIRRSRSTIVSQEQS